MDRAVDIHDAGYVRDLFDRVSATYGYTNYIASFGFTERWRKQCIEKRVNLRGSAAAPLWARESGPLDAPLKHRPAWNNLRRLRVVRTGPHPPPLLSEQVPSIKPMPHTPASSDPPPVTHSYLYRRHTWPIRLMHWVNVVALTVLLMSGLQIFNAYPALHWGQSSYTGAAPLLEMREARTPRGERIGVTRFFGHELDTTGVLGLSRNASGELTERAFPSWATVPGDRWLAMGRRWHFFFAWLFVMNGVAYLVYSVTTRHLSRNLLPTSTDWRSMGRSIADHLRFLRPRGEAAKHYNPLQKLSYVLLIFVLMPLVIFTGWSMSPWLNSVWPGWVEVFGGRQSGRTLHFLAAWLLVLFVLVHVFEVIMTGFWNNLRSIITGRYRVTAESTHERE